MVSWCPVLLIYTNLIKLYCCSIETQVKQGPARSQQLMSMCTLMYTCRAATFAGAGRGQEGLAAEEHSSGPQAEGPCNEQRWKLLLWWHDLSHYQQRQPQCYWHQRPSPLWGKTTPTPSAHAN